MSTLRLFSASFLSLIFLSATLGCGGGSEEAEPSVGNGGGGGGAAVLPKPFVKYGVDTFTDLTVTVADVTSGQVVTLFSDAGCTTQVASATASATKVDFNLTGVSAGAHTYYAKAGSSACSTVVASYTLASCPAGYVKVDGDPELGTKPFCVMQFEAKNVSGVATSQAAQAPWMNISAIDAKAACRSLNSGGNTNFDLISSLEWQTVAIDYERNLTDNSYMWNSDLNLYQGNSNNDALPSAVADVTNPWTGITHNGAPNPIQSCRRTEVLRNGSVVWDMAGNAHEIVDYGTEATYTSPPTCGGTASAGDAPYQVKAANTCTKTPYQHFMTISQTGSGNSGFGHVQTRNTADVVLMRGGGYNGSAGLSSFIMSGLEQINTSSTSSFRCVYRLNPPTRPTAPTVAKDLVATITVAFTNAQPGETITLSTNAVCSNNVGSAVATTSTPTLTATMPSAGAFSIYFKTTSLAGVESPCQPRSVSYQYLTCPSGYIAVPANSTRSVASFCIQKFEARRDSNYALTNDPADTYFTNYNGNNRYKQTCTGLNNYPSQKYDLVSNQEWMTIADNIYNVAFNWSGGTVGSGMIARGVSGSAAPAALGDPGSNYWFGVVVGGSPTTAHQYRRMLRLSNGSEIWDFAGNKGDVVDMGTDFNAFANAPACSTGDGATAEELSNAATSCPEISTVHLAPYNTAKTSADGMGQFIPRQSASSATRGGIYNGAETAGIYAFGGVADGDNAFRCVWRP